MVSMEPLFQTLHADSASKKTHQPSAIVNWPTRRGDNAPHLLSPKRHLHIKLSTIKWAWFDIKVIVSSKTFPRASSRTSLFYFLDLPLVSS